MKKQMLIIVGLGIVLLFLSMLQQGFYFLSFILFTIVIIRFSGFRPTVNILIIVAFIIFDNLTGKIRYLDNTDLECNDGLFLTTIIPVSCSFLMFGIFSIADKRYKLRDKVVAICLGIILIPVYFYYFFNFGVVRINMPSKASLSSRSQNLFIYSAICRDSIFSYAGDTYIATDVWIEQETKTSYWGLFDKTRPTGNYNYCLSLHGRFDDNMLTRKLYYSLSSKTTNGVRPIDSFMSLVKIVVHSLYRYL